MSFFNNNFTGMNFGHPSVDEEFPYFGTPYTDTFDLEALIAGPSGSQNLNPDPPTVGYADQSGHQESTLLDASGNQFVDPYTPQMAPTYDHYAGESRCFLIVTVWTDIDDRPRHECLWLERARTAHKHTC